tara:strand:- start:228 stop:449 length:222 start_codon:yes stop_codon:yes gene_type:complete
MTRVLSNCLTPKRTHRKKQTSGTQDRWCSMDEEYDDHECDHCEGNEEYYEFYEDGHRYHGYECGVCGKLLQTG